MLEKINNIKHQKSDNFLLIAGPCVIEEEEIAMEIAEKTVKISNKLEIPFIFKGSYRKANRSRLDSFSGIGDIKALEILKKIGKHFNIPVLTDIHSNVEADIAAKYVDVLQIPAFLCRQTDLISSVAESGLPVNVKKGQFLSPAEVRNIIMKFEHFKNKNILICERGTTFGYNNLVVDMLGLAELKKYEYPVIFDVTHSLQEPGGEGKSTSGRRSLALDLAKAATSIGIAGLFLETHPDPDKAKCDGPCALPLKNLKGFLDQINNIDSLVKTFPKIEIS